MGVTLILYVIVCWGSDMDLIKQLGGYEKAKSYVVDANACGAFDDENKIKSALLEHRRANNIFEVGDKVIRLDVDNIFIYTVQKVTLDLITVVRKKKPNAVQTWGMWLGNNELRHTTDEEIAAGHRL